MSTEKIAIIGLSGLYPGADNPAALGMLLEHGVDCVRPLSADRKRLAGLDPESACLPIAYLEDPSCFDYEFFGLSRKEAEYMDPHQRLLLTLACQTIENAGYSLSSVRGRRVATLVAAAGPGYRRLIRCFDPMALSGNIPAALAGRIAYTLDLRGPAMVIDTACSSSLVAVVEACRRLHSGEADLALAGGVNLFFAEDHLDSDAVGIIAPDGRSKAFDATANGSGWGEGGGMVLLKLLALALADRDHIHGVILGGAVNQDGGRSNGLTAPSPEAQRDVIVEAWRNADLDPETLSLFEAHGTGTKLGDPIEIQGITQAFRQFTEKTQFCAVGSVKTNIGHLVGAAGMAGLTKVLLSFRSQSLFPSLHFDRPNPFIAFESSPVRVNTELRPWPAPEGAVRRAAVSSFGLSGTNAHIVLEEPPSPPVAANPAQPVLLKVSAKTAIALREYAGSVAHHLRTDTGDVDAFAFTLDTGRDDFAFRIAVAGSNPDRLAQALLEAAVNHAHAFEKPRPLVLVLSEDAALSADLPAQPERGRNAFASSMHEIRELAGSRATNDLQRFAVIYSAYRAGRACGLEFQTVLGSGIANLAVRVITGAMPLAEAVRAAIETPPACVPLDKDRLKQCIQEIASSARPLFICAGEGGALAAAIAEMCGETNDLDVCRFAAVPDTGFLPDLAKAYCLGATINWNVLFNGSLQRRVEAPVYPFARVSCWIDPAPQARSESACDESDVTAEIFGSLDGQDGTLAQHQLAAIWGEVLKCKTISPTDEFFDLGGNSLNGVQVLNRVAERFGVKLDFEAFYDFPTLADFAAELDTRASTTSSVQPAGAAIETAKEPASASDAFAPLSHAQQRLWFLDQLDPGRAMFNLAFAISIEGALDRSALDRAVNEISHRHEALRTTIVSRNGRPLQRISPYVPRPIPMLAVDDCKEENPLTCALALVARDSSAPFCLSEGPLWRIRLIQLKDTHHLLTVSMHHIVSDAWSIGIFVRELGFLYRAFSAEQPSPLRDVPVAYSLLCARENTAAPGSDEAHLAYWKQNLAGAPELLELPFDQPRGTAASRRGARHNFVFLPALAAAVRAIADQQNVTPFMVLMAALQIVLSRYSGQHDIVVGTPVAGRHSAEAEQPIGLFVNTILIRGDLSARPSWRDFVRQIRQTALAAFAHQTVRFESVVDAVRPERNTAHSPLFQVMLMYQNITMEETQIPGLSWSLIEPETGSIQFDLTLAVVERGPSLDGRVDYAADLFEPETIQHFIGALENVLAAAARHPDWIVDTLPLLAPDHAISFEQGDDRDWNLPASIEQIVALHAQRFPDASALATAGRSYSYGDFTTESNRLGRWMLQQGAGPDSVVALSFGRSPELIIAMFAVLCAGAAYLVLDPEYPLERARYMLADAKPVLLLTDEAGFARWATNDASGTPVFSHPRLRENLRTFDSGPMVPRAQPDNLAYVVYTSGSTGHPKAVMVTRRALANFALGMADQLSVTDRDRVLQFASPSFDASAVQIYPVLARGGLLFLHPNPGRLSNIELLRLCETERISILDVPAAFWRQIIQDASHSGVPAPHCIRVFATGGESIPARILQQWSVWCRGEASFLSSYGPTEATVTSTVFHINASEAATRSGVPLPLGRALPNTGVLVLDGHFQPVPDNAIGQAYVTGVGLARGYLKAAALTASRFLPNPHASTPGERMYATGDLVRRCTNGHLVFLGRNDNQQKIRGFRVETGEVEAALLRHPAVREVVASVRLDSAGNASLAAYMVLHVGIPRPERQEMREFAARFLPDYMVPASIAFVEGIPRTVHEKGDLAALHAMEVSEALASNLTPPNATESKVAAIWAELLDRPQISIDENFFSLGGHSLLAVQLISRVRETLTVEIPLRLLFEYPTVRSFARHALPQAAAAESSIPRTSRDAALPLSFAQQRFWVAEKIHSAGRLNIVNAIEVVGPLNVPALERSLTAIVARHEALRTAFTAEGDGPVQRVLAPFAIEIPVADLTDLSDAAQQSAIDVRINQESRRRFDLENGRVAACSLLQLSSDRSLLLLTFHHIAFDGWSLKVFLNELSTSYSAYCTGSVPVLPELPLQYPDYAAWQRRTFTPEAIRNRLEQYLSGLLTAPASLNLPSVSGPQPAPGIAARYSFTVPAAVAQALASFAGAESATTFVTALAVFAAVLKRYSGQDDILLGIDIADRQRKETEPLIGCFVNHVLVRADLRNRSQFREIVRQVRESMLAAYSNAEVPFEWAVQELRRQRPDFDPVPFGALVILQETLPQEALGFEGLALLPREIPPVTPKVDLTLFLQPGRDGISGLLEYNASRFDGPLIHALADDYVALLSAAAADPDGSLDAVPPSSPGMPQLEVFNEVLA